MNNTIGFEKDRWYKVVSTGDNTVLQVDGAKIICAKEDETKKDCQRFQAIQQEDGRFRLAARYQESAESDATQVLDYLPHRCLLIQKKKTAAEVSTQIWRSETVFSLNCVFFILSVPNADKCLKNMNSETAGIGQQVQLVDKSNAQVAGDSYTHWRLEPESLDSETQVTSGPSAAKEASTVVKKSENMAAPKTKDKSKKSCIIM